jgi:hypothetical protein
MKFKKILEKFLSQQYAILLPFSFILSYLIFDNTSVTEILLYPLIVAIMLTVMLNTKLKKLFNSDNFPNKSNEISLITNLSKEELIKKLKSSKRWDADIIEEYENKILIISNMSIFTIGNIIIIDFEENNELNNIKIKSISGNIQKNEEINSKLEIDKIAFYILNYNQEKISK